MLSDAQEWSSWIAVSGGLHIKVFHKNYLDKDTIRNSKNIPDLWYYTCCPGHWFLVLAFPKGYLNFLLKQFLSEFHIELIANVPPTLAPNPLLFPWSKIFSFFTTEWSWDFDIFMVNGVGGKGGIPKECHGIWVILFKEKRFNFNLHSELNQDLAHGHKYSIFMSKCSPSAPVKIVDISLHSEHLSKFS